MRILNSVFQVWLFRIELWYIHLHVSPLNLSCCYLRELAKLRVVTSDAAQSSWGKYTLPVLLSDGFHWGAAQRAPSNTGWVAAGDRDSEDRFYFMAKITDWSVQLTLFITVQKTKWLEERNEAHTWQSCYSSRGRDTWGSCFSRVKMQQEGSVFRECSHQKSNPILLFQVTDFILSPMELQLEQKL